MKVFVGVLLLATVIEFSVATRVFSNHEIVKNQKYRVHREPPLEGHVTFNDVEIVEEKWIEQRLNNFDPQDETRWNMRYLENNFYLQPGGPIFIYIGEFSRF